MFDVLFLFGAVSLRMLLSSRVGKQYIILYVSYVVGQFIIIVVVFRLIDQHVFLMACVYLLFVRCSPMWFSWTF